MLPSLRNPRGAILKVANCDQERPVSVRICAGCRSRRVASELIRLTGADGRVVPDIERELGGRGVHLCANRGCASKAMKRGALSRTLRRPVGLTEDELHNALESSFARSLRKYVRGSLRNEAQSRGTDAGAALLLALREAPGAPLPRPAFTDSNVQARASWLWRGLSEFTSVTLDANNPPPCRGSGHQVT